MDINKEQHEELLFGDGQSFNEVYYDSRLESRRCLFEPFESSYILPDSCRTMPKRQFSSNCWAYALAESVRSYLLLQNIIKNKDDIYVDFSECHMTYEMFDVGRQNGGSSSNPNGKMPMYNQNGYYTYGANTEDAISLVARGTEFVCEKCDPNPPHKKNFSLIDRSLETTSKKKVKYYVSSIKRISDPPQGITPPYTRWIDDVKYCIKAYGAVRFSMTYADAYMNKVMPAGMEIQSYFSIPSSDFPDNVKANSGGHAVVIIGWDDKYDKSNFTQQMGASGTNYSVKSNGAFLVKDSHGITDKWDGHFWMSYEDFNYKNGFCITGIDQDVLEKPHQIYGNTYGETTIMTSNKINDDKVEFQITYKSKGKNEMLIGVGLFNSTPCIADVALNGVDIIGKYPLYDAGYQFIRLDRPHNIGAANTDFTLTCKYSAMQYGKVFVPIERHYVYPNQIKQSDLEIYPNASYGENSSVNGQKVTDINQSAQIKYGDVALFAITQKTDEVCKIILEAYEKLQLPEAKDNRIDDLPSSYTALTGEQVSLEWRLEPKESEIYMPDYPKSNVKEYYTGKSKGIINLSEDKPEEAVITCVIGEAQMKEWRMCKLFTAILSKKPKEYEFEVLEVKNGYQAGIKGQGVPAGSTVIIESNNSSVTITADESGKWSVSDFPLYKVDFDKKEGWKDTFASTRVKVTIQDSSPTSVIMLTGTSDEIKLEKPYSESTGKLGEIILTIAGTVTASSFFAAMVEAFSSGQAGVGGAGVVITAGGYVNIASQGVAGQSIFGTGYESLELEGAVDNPLVVELNAPMFGAVHRVSNVTLRVNMDMVLSPSCANISDGNPLGMLAGTITKGGCVKNCSVIGTVKGGSSSDIGGLFGTGEDVTVENCKCSLEVHNVSSYGGIAHTLSGASHVNGCEVTGTAVVRNRVAGIVVNHQGESIMNCCVAANLTGRYSTGVACIMTDGSAIEKCMTSCRLTALDGGMAMGVAPGISSKPEAVMGCASLCSHLGGKNPARVSVYPGMNNIAYGGIHCDDNENFVDDGAVLKDWYELASQDTFSALGWDFAEVWEYVTTSMHIRLKGSEMAYYYPFFIVAKTINGKFQIQKDQQLTVTGAKRSDMSKVKWTGLLPENGASPDDGDYWETENIFLTTVPVKFTQEGDFILMLSADLDQDEYVVMLPVTVTK